MSKKPVVVYGASGYTGRLICEALRNYQLPFIAAGRDAKRVEDAMRLVPGIETAEYEVVGVAHETGALADLFVGSQVVCNTVGPFHHFGETVVAAAAEAGVHYLDTTGEILFMDRARERYGAAYGARGKVLAPSTAYMYTPLEIAAHIVLETPGIDTLEAICSATGTPTYGSTQSIFTMFEAADTSFYVENRRRTIWPSARGYEVVVPGLPMTQLALPWGGGTLPLYFERDARVRSCRQLTTFTNRALFEQVIAMQQMYEKDIKPLAPPERAARIKAIGESIQPGMPPRENPLVHRCVEHVEGRGGNRSASCTIRSFMPYLLTGVVQAATANFLIGGRQLAAGFVSACQAVGHHEILGQLQNFGLVEITKTS
jgi:hypothetical protein